MKERERSPDTLKMVTGPSFIYPLMPTPMPDSKWVSNSYRSTILKGIVQWANNISPVSGLMDAGLAWKPLTPSNDCAIFMESIAGTSPSQPATIPSALSLARARQPVLWTAVNRSKQRMVKPCSWCLLTIVFKASYIWFATGRAFLTASAEACSSGSCKGCIGYDIQQFLHRNVDEADAKASHDGILVRIT